MTIEKKTIRSDIPGSHVFLNGNVGYVGSTADEARRLVIGRDLTLQGQIAACNHLVIEGTVQADSFSARRMDILEPGLFTGSAEVQECVIAGRFEGRLSVSGRLTVKSTGQIRGEVQYGAVEIENGGKIDGHMISMAPVAAPAAEVPNNVEKLFVAPAETTAEQPEITGRAAAYRRVAAGR